MISSERRVRILLKYAQAGYTPAQMAEAQRKYEQADKHTLSGGWIKDPKTGRWGRPENVIPGYSPQGLNWRNPVSAAFRLMEESTPGMPIGYFTRPPQPPPQKAPATPRRSAVQLRTQQRLKENRWVRNTRGLKTESYGRHGRPLVRVHGKGHPSKGSLVQKHPNHWTDVDRATEEGKRSKGYTSHDPIGQAAIETVATGGLSLGPRLLTSGLKGLKAGIPTVLSGARNLGSRIMSSTPSMSGLRSAVSGGISRVKGLPGQAMGAVKSWNPVGTAKNFLQNTRQGVRKRLSDNPLAHYFPTRLKDRLGTASKPIRTQFPRTPSPTIDWARGGIPGQIVNKVRKRLTPERSTFPRVLETLSPGFFKRAPIKDRAGKMISSGHSFRNQMAGQAMLKLPAALGQDPNRTHVVKGKSWMNPLNWKKGNIAKTLAAQDYSLPGLAQIGKELAWDLPRAAYGALTAKGAPSVPTPPKPVPRSVRGGYRDHYRVP